MSSAPSASWKEIGWNGLTFQCPKSWDTIISGKQHLVFEDNFKPVLELRWNKSKNDTENTTKTILHNLQKDSGLFPHKSLPASWQQLTDRFTIHLLIEETKSLPNAALLCCKECGITLLFYFFKTLPAHHTDVVTLLGSLCCHKEEKEQTLWAVQDFRLFLPGEYQLSSYNFAAGLTRLSFQYGSFIIHICRLAPASQRLQALDLADLLLILGDISTAKENIKQTEDTVSHSRHPPIYKQILDRFKRKLPFHEIMLRHHQECDRLTGVFLFDKKPIPEDRMPSILDSYEIFPI